MKINYQRNFVYGSYLQDTNDHRVEITFRFDSAEERDAFVATMPKVSNNDLANSIRIIDPLTDQANSLRRALGVSELKDWRVNIIATYALEKRFSQGKMVEDVEFAAELRAKGKFLNSLKWNAWLIENGIEVNA